MKTLWAVIFLVLNTASGYAQVTPGCVIATSSSIGCSRPDNSSITILGGVLSATGFSGGILAPANGGTGINNGTNTLTVTAPTTLNGTPSGVGLQGGQSPTGVGDSSLTLTVSKYLYFTNATFTAPRTWTLPSSAAQGAGDFEVFDKQQTLTSTNTLTLMAGGTDKLNGITNGSIILYVAGSSVRISNDGAGNYTVAGALTLPNLPSGDVYVGNAAGQPVASAVSTGLSSPAGGPITSNAVEHISYQPGLLSAVNATKAAFHKFSKASTVDNIEGSAATFSCVSNPTITIYECGTSSTCASSPTTIGTVTVTAAGTVVDGTVSSSAITAGDYVAFAMTAGTCASVDIAATVQVHAN